MITDEQTLALDQLRELTNGADDEVSIAVLSTVDWDVHRAAELIFDQRPPPPPPPPPPIQPFEIDDSHHRQPQPPRPLIAFFSFPFHIITAIVRFVFSLLRIPFPRLPAPLGLIRFSGLTLFSQRSTSTRRDGRPGCGEPWFRELEDETGAVWLGRVLRASQDRAVSSAVSLPLPVAEHTQVVWGDGKKYLPNFETCDYEAFLRKAIREKKVACVVLLSEEHDDVLHFKRSTLIDQLFVRRLHEAGVLCWGGDIRDPEAWSAAEKLQATTYPFVAFIALQSRRGSNVLTILSRHQGRSSTSASTLTAHLDSHVLPRVLPFLNTLLYEDKARERDRLLRAEQDRAYEETRRRDRQKWEREERERSLRRQEQLRREAEERERVERELRRAETRAAVRRAVAASRAPAEGLKGKGKEKDGEGEGEVRVVLRMPAGQRIVERFAREDSVSVLYATVDALLLLSGDEGGDDGVEEGKMDVKMGELDGVVGREGGKDFWGFKLVNAYPRKEIEWRAGVKIGAVDSLVGGGQIVVERDVVVNGDGDGCETEEEED